MWKLNFHLINILPLGHNKWDKHLTYFKQERSVTGANVCVTERYVEKLCKKVDNNFFMQLFWRNYFLRFLKFLLEQIGVR